MAAESSFHHTWGFGLIIEHICSPLFDLVQLRDSHWAIEAVGFLLPLCGKWITAKICMKWAPFEIDKHFGKMQNTKSTWNCGIGEWSSVRGAAAHFLQFSIGKMSSGSEERIQWTALCWPRRGHFVFFLSALRLHGWLPPNFVHWLKEIF